MGLRRLQSSQNGCYDILRGDPYGTTLTPSESAYPSGAPVQFVAVLGDGRRLQRGARGGSEPHAGRERGHQGQLPARRPLRPVQDTAAHPLHLGVAAVDRGQREVLVRVGNLRRQGLQHRRPGGGHEATDLRQRPDRRRVDPHHAGPLGRPASAHPADPFHRRQHAAVRGGILPGRGKGRSRGGGGAAGRGGAGRGAGAGPRQGACQEEGLPLRVRRGHTDPP